MPFCVVSLEATSIRTAPGRGLGGSRRASVIHRLPENDLLTQQGLSSRRTRWTSVLVLAREPQERVRHLTGPRTGPEGQQDEVIVALRDPRVAGEGLVVLRAGADQDLRQEGVATERRGEGLELLVVEAPAVGDAGDEQGRPGVRVGGLLGVLVDAELVVVHALDTGDTLHDEGRRLLERELGRLRFEVGGTPVAVVGPGTTPANDADATGVESGRGLVLRLGVELPEVGRHGRQDVDLGLGLGPAVGVARVEELPHGEGVVAHGDDLQLLLVALAVDPRVELLEVVDFAQLHDRHAALPF